ncbi:MAG: galactose-1-phosphate uridylyltransferase [Candidatus Bathyarchaeota archaeon]|nr:galactose-1-phosphate uridylyltransferase [Candidatus Bathyarchaeota archaeon]
MIYNELRRDYLLERWVVIATERARRPTDLSKQRVEQGKFASCPLCPGNENMTPPAVLVYLPNSGEGNVKKDSEQNDFRHKNWVLRCIPNLFPAFSPPRQEADADHIMKDNTYGYAVGHHEVIIESPNHADHPANAKTQQLIQLINAYKDRLAELSTKPYVKYVQIFRNHGSDAGASLSHAHSQIIAMPFTPKILSDEMTASKTYYERHKRCVFCDLVDQETRTLRHIMDNEHFTVFSPYASIHPMEFWVLPKRHSPNFLDLTEGEIRVFAETLKITMRALKDAVNDPPYNYGFHLALNRETQEYYHWHLEVYPKLTMWAGFEKSTGVYINTVPPEVASAELKKTMHN